MQRSLFLLFTAALSLPAPVLAQEEFPQDPLENTCGDLSGWYEVTFPGGVKKNARLRSPAVNTARLSLDMPSGGTIRVELTRQLDDEENHLRTVQGMTGPIGEQQNVRVDLLVEDRVTLVGKVEERQASGWKTTEVRMRRAPGPRRTAAEMAEFDPGPSPEQLALFESIPQEYQQYFQYLWWKWGPTYYRGRLDKSARLLILGSDPGPTECMPYVRRCMIGDTGQRVQGLITKLGLTKSYVIMNAFAYALFPSASNAGAGDDINSNPAIVAWRNKIFASSIGSNLQAVILFGFQARKAWDMWPNRPNLPSSRIFYLPHPSRYGGEPDSNLIPSYKRAVDRLRQIVTPDDPQLVVNTPNYGEEFTEFDFQPIPRRDLPKGATISGQWVETPEWIGSDSWTRVPLYPLHNVVKRPSPDSGKNRLILSFPPDGTQKKTIKVTPDATNPGKQPTYEWQQ